MATHSSVLAWRIPGMGEPGGLPSMGSHKVGHNWNDLAAAAAAKLEGKENTKKSPKPMLLRKWVNIINNYLRKSPTQHVAIIIWKFWSVVKKRNSTTKFKILKDLRLWWTLIQWSRKYWQQIKISFMGFIKNLVLELKTSPVMKWSSIQARGTIELFHN